MKAAQGILTVRGGMTSHAAVVARGMGTCCVSGCGDIVMDEENKQFELWPARPSTRATGSAWTAPPATSTASAIPTVDASIGGEFGRIMAWADKYRQPAGPHQRRQPPRTPRRPASSAPRASACAAPSTCSSTSDRIPAIREMICSDTVEQREKALAKLEPMQQGDFEGIYEAMEG